MNFNSCVLSSIVVVVMVILVPMRKDLLGCDSLPSVMINKYSKNSTYAAANIISNTLILSLRSTMARVNPFVFNFNLFKKSIWVSRSPVEEISPPRKLVKSCLTRINAKVR